MRIRIQFLFIFCAHFLVAQEWRYTGPGKMNFQVKGMIKSLWIDPENPDIVLAGSNCGGLFLTENAQTAEPIWRNISDTYKGMVFGVTDIVVVPGTNRKTIFISTGQNSSLPQSYGNGILKTEDGGKTWNRVGPGMEIEFTFPLEGLVANPANSTEMIAYGAHELYYTRDAWKNYSKIGPELDKNNRNMSFCDVEFAPMEPGKFYVCYRMNGGGSAGAYELTDYGKTMRNITPSGIDASRIDISVVNDARFKGKYWIAYGRSDCYVGYYNGIRLEHPLNSQPVVHTYNDAYWNFEFQVNQVDTSVMYLAMTEASRSVNGGKSFAKIALYNGNNTHADNRAMVLSRSSIKALDDHLFLGNDGGVSFVKGFAPLLWKNLNGTGLDVDQFWGVSVLQSDTFFIAGGTQDNGGFFMNRAESICNIYGCGDGYLATVLDDSSAIIQCNTPLMSYFNYRNNKVLSLSVADNRYDVIRPMKRKGEEVYVGFRDLWKISVKQLRSGETAMSRLTELKEERTSNGNVSNNTMRSLSVGNKGSALISYREPNWGDVNNKGKLYFTEDISSSRWIDITNDAVCEGFAVCQWAEVNASEIDPDDPYRFFILARDVFYQTNSKVYEMRYWPDSAKCTIREIGKSLPKIGLNSLLMDRYSRMLYLAADNGVYVCDPDMDSPQWKKFNTEQNSIPSVMVFGLDINYATNTLYAATFGRGIWQTQIPTSGKGKLIRSGEKKVFQEPYKIDGKLVLGRKSSLELNSKVIICKGSVIQLKRGSRLIVKDKNLVRDEHNHQADINKFISK